jgi:[ribosomal protein S18]-alanine N-acetyltransferase
MTLLLRRLREADLDRVAALEARCHESPWRRGQFADSLAAGHLAWVLEEGRALRGYLVAMLGVDEMHLLDITIDPACRGQGHARRLLAELADACRAARAPLLWLEVREGNAAARRLYTAWGFEPVGRRKGYYARADGSREDAVVMRWAVATDEEAA